MFSMSYLVNQLGIATGFSFNYHHYGPYSDELADKVEDDVVFGRISVQQKRRADGVPFVIYRSPDHVQDDKTESLFATPRTRMSLSAMQSRSATILELAATIHWLAFIEKVDNWRAELVRRKGVKTEDGRAEAALELLAEMQIAPA
jgi:uncharacterized protein